MTAARFGRAAPAGIIGIVKPLCLSVAVLGLSFVLLIGCKKDIQNDDAVKQGIQNYLSKRPDLLAMDVSVKSVAYHQDEATATVHFQAKGNNSPNTGMDMQYVLERKSNQWVVKGRAGAEGHGAGVPQGMGQPQGQPEGGSLGAMPQTLPPGHPTTPPAAGPATGGPTGELPPGHPPVPKKPGQDR